MKKALSFALQGSNQKKKYHQQEVKNFISGGSQSISTTKTFAVQSISIKSHYKFFEEKS